ncbi:MAG: pyruvate ferredoxin oxidoreductase subunit gamma [Candidatus Diapherotrites archaeon]
MKEIRIHGRGGQGAVTSSQVLAVAAFLEGKHSQAFPNFGVERTGAPVMSYTRISDDKIHIRSHVYEPDYVIVLDPSLIKAVDVTEGLKDSGMLIINSHKQAKDLGIKGKFEVKNLDITKVALEVIGKPFVNIAALAAFAAFTGEVKLETLKKAIDEKLGDKGKIAELNKQAADKVYGECKK